MSQDNLPSDVSAKTGLPTGEAGVASITPVLDRAERAVAQAIANGSPPRHIARRVLEVLMIPSLDVLVQGCHALEGKNAKNMIDEAEYSGDRYEKARVKMRLRWRAMVKSIMAGM